MSNRQKSFVKGAAILGAAGLIVKVIGAFFRVFLTNIIDLDGMAYYQVAYPVYAFLVVISTAGLPAAISKMVSERVTLGDYRGAHKVFQKAFKILLIIGFVSTILMLAFSGLIAKANQMPKAYLSLMMISPSLFFVSLLSAYRGYFQGLQHMTPTALTQIVEQLIKLSAGLLFAWLWVDKGLEYGAAGALLGVSLSEVCALIVIIIIYNRKKKSFKELRQHAAVNRSIPKLTNTTSRLIAIALPITLAASIMPLIMSLDSLIINNVLPTVDYAAYNPLTPKESFGLLTGAVNSLINMPAVLSLALCMSLVPAIAESRANMNSLAVSNRSAMGFKLAALVGLPSAVGMFLLAKPILSLLYTGLNEAELTIGTQLLQIMCIGVLFLTMLQTMSGILQGAGKPFIPLVTLAIGAGVKIALSLVLIRQPSLNINGAAIGTAACYGVASILNVFAMIKVTKAKIKLGSGVLMPIVSAGVMGVVVFYMNKTLQPAVGNTGTVVLSILGAALVYVVMLFATGGLQKEDMTFIPGGRRVTHFMNKLGFWGE